MKSEREKEIKQQGAASPLKQFLRFERSRRTGEYIASQLTQCCGAPGSDTLFCFVEVV